MSSRFAFERLADGRHDAQLLIDRADDQDGQLAALVAAAEEDARHAEAVVSHAADRLDVDDVRHLLSAQLERRLAGAAVAWVRLISGTTVSLLDRFAAGTFSEQLFYRLNIIHLMACDRPVYVAGADDAPGVHVHGPSTPKLAR